MTYLLAALLACYAVAGTASGIVTARLFAGRRLAEAERMTVYRKIMIQGWACAIGLGALAFAAGFSPRQLGLTWIGPGAFGIGPLATSLTVALAAALALWMIVRSVRLASSAPYRARVWDSLACPAPAGGDGGAGGAADDGYRPARDVTLEMLLPRSRRQRRAFFLVSLTAGVCEEFIYRGLMFAVLRTLIPGIGPYVLIAAVSLVFALGHVYQGAAGVAKILVVGTLFAMLYAATGSLVPGMVLHGILDASNAFFAPTRT